MASALATREAPSYSSSRVQRAARLNNVEATKLLQQLQCLEKEKQHQCRMTNQDIRLVSMSIDYIQAHSGNSQEAWRPHKAIPEETDDTEKSEGPCFMYGERIISRKKRRFARPMSAVERTNGRSLQENSNSLGVNDVNDIPRPKSCSNENRARSASAMSWMRLNENHYVDDKDGAESGNDTARSGYTVSRPNSAGSVTHSVRDAWEEETTDVTKKILKAQAQAQMGKRQSVYQSAGAVMSAQSSKKVRDLARKIRINSTQISMNNVDLSLTRNYSQGADMDKPPKKPNFPKNNLGKRATTSDILNQNKPTLSAGAWRQHISRNSHATPVSSSAQQRARLEARKHLNETRKADVEEKVKDFMVKKKS